MRREKNVSVIISIMAITPDGHVRNLKAMIFVDTKSDESPTLQCWLNFTYKSNYWQWPELNSGSEQCHFVKKLKPKIASLSKFKLCMVRSTFPRLIKTWIWALFLSFLSLSSRHCWIVFFKTFLDLNLRTAVPVSSMIDDAGILSRSQWRQKIKPASCKWVNMVLNVHKNRKAY